MEALHLDTHAAVWLYAGQVELFSRKAHGLLEDRELFISPAVLLEIQFLKEVGKVEISPDRFLQDMKKDLDLKVCEEPFFSVAVGAVELSWTRDPFDRLIVAQAQAAEAMLLTRDKLISRYYPRSVW